MPAIQARTKATWCGNNLFQAIGRSGRRSAQGADDFRMGQFVWSLPATVAPWLKAAQLLA